MEIEDVRKLQQGLDEMLVLKKTKVDYLLSHPEGEHVVDVRRDLRMLDSSIDNLTNRIVIAKMASEKPKACSQCDCVYHACNSDQCQYWIVRNQDIDLGQRKCEQKPKLLNDDTN